MNVKMPVALAVLAASTVAVSACASSTSKSAASTPNAPSATSVSATSPSALSGSAPGSSSGSSSAASDSSSSAGASVPSSPARTYSGPLRTDIPDSALVTKSDLASTGRGVWTLNNGNQTTPASEIIDPDNCDPVARPQSVDPSYPRNPAWSKMGGASWTGPNNVQFGESVITYKSVAAAQADFAKHKGWVANCSTNFQYSDQPSKAVSTDTDLGGLDNAYGIRVVMYSPDKQVSTANVQAYAYMAVVLRGNTLTVLNLSAGTSDSGKVPQDPGAGGFQQDVQAAAPKLAATFGS